VDASQIQQMLFEQHALRVEPEMARYIGRQLNRSEAALHPVFIIAGDARTGMPLRQQLPPTRPTASAKRPRGSGSGTSIASSPARPAQGELFS
jgi:hypothetical protein